MLTLVFLSLTAAEKIDITAEKISALQKYTPNCFSYVAGIKIKVNLMFEALKCGTKAFLLKKELKLTDQELIQ